MYITIRTIEKNKKDIWRKPNRDQLAVKGQTRIPSVAVLLKLVSMAMAEGWGNIDADKDVLDIEPEEQK